jgi:transcriptional regulator with XRE-family HTH domain
MPSRKPAIKQEKIVERFGNRLRELRVARGMTQVELARKAHVAPTYMWKLEGGVAAPGIDLVERLAVALGTTANDLLPTADQPDPLPLLREQAGKLFSTLLETADVPTLSMLCPLLARLAESPTRRR